MKSIKIKKSESYQSLIKIEGERAVWNEPSNAYKHVKAQLEIFRDLVTGRAWLVVRNKDNDEWRTPWAYWTYYPIKIERYDDTWGIAYEIKGNRMALPGYTTDISIRVSVVPDKEHNYDVVLIQDEQREMTHFTAKLSSVKKLYELVKNMMEIK